MKTFTEACLQILREKVDLVDLLSSFISLKRVGATYKGLCPFHEEKSPSFIVKKGDSHYHCFGCQAHGDAISFLMLHQGFSFVEAVEYLADKFGVHLEYSEKTIEGSNKRELKEALNLAMRFFHYYLLHSDEGRKALEYLYNRGIDLQFIKMFRLGLAPSIPHIFQKVMYQAHISNKVLIDAGLIKISGDKKRDFFIDRIMFPIQDVMGSTIGFSARKYKQETFGPKYVNTGDTPLFKKSHILFGLSYSRKDITKQKRAIIVEGQIDALRLIYTGFTTTVAAQGTAFGETHVQMLVNLGVEKVFLALDGDKAGKEAARKIGHLFQKEAIEVKVVQLPIGSDPDQILIEEGTEFFENYLEKSLDYLTFIVQEAKKGLDMQSPAQKNSLVASIVKQIRQWEHPLLIHESLRKLAQLTHTPENVLGIGERPSPNVLISKEQSIQRETISVENEIEADLLRWLFLAGDVNKKWIEMIALNIKSDHFFNPVCQKLFIKYMQKYQENAPRDFLSLNINEEEEQKFIEKLMHKKINWEKESGLILTIQKLLDRKWMQKREEIKKKIHSGQCSEKEAFDLAKEFDAMKKERPQIIEPKEA